MRRPRRRFPSTRSSTALERDVLPFVARDQPPGLPRLHPGRGDVARRARRPDRERAQRRHRAGGSAPPGRARSSWSCSTGSASGSATRTARRASSSRAARRRTSRRSPARARRASGAMDEDAVVYMSDQTHSSLARAARALGFRPDQVRVIPTDERARIRAEACAARSPPTGRRAAAAGPGRERRHDRRRRRRPASPSWRRLPRARRLAPRRRRLRRVRLPQRAGPAALAGHRARRLDHARPAQVALPADRGAARCSSATATLLRRGFEITPDYLATSRLPTRR